MGSVIAWFGAAMAFIFGFILFFSVWFGIMTNIFGFKYRRDANLSLRKDTHISVIENYNGLIKYQNDRDMIDENKYDIKLLSLFVSPLSKKKYRDFWKKNIIIDKKVILEEFKNWKTLDSDFRISKKQTFNHYVKNLKIDDKFTLNNKEDAVNLLTLILILSNTDSIELLNYDPKFKPIIKFIKQMSLTKRQLKAQVKSNEITKEELEDISKQQEEVAQHIASLVDEPEIQTHEIHTLNDDEAYVKAESIEEVENRKYEDLEDDYLGEPRKIKKEKEAHVDQTKSNRGSLTNAGPSETIDLNPG